jgi:hypothetical protein
VLAEQVFENDGIDPAGGEHGGKLAKEISRPDNSIVRLEGVEILVGVVGFATAVNATLDTFP